MSEITYTTEDKSEWGDGPWQDEPDKIQYTDEVTGYPCLIKRNRMGNLCGYVGVSEGHPWFGKGYGDVPAVVHGGLTYADMCQEGDEAHSICHIPAPGEPDHVWWLGFDCGHGFDLMPAMEAEARKYKIPWGLGDLPGTTYKTVGYVRAQNALLAGQAKEAMHE